MVITVKLVDDRPKAKVKKRKQSPGFRHGKYWITRKEVLKNKYLNKAEREALLDMCGGVTVKSVKKVGWPFLERGKYPKIVAKYFVDGIVYCDVSIDEVSEFYGV